MKGGGGRALQSNANKRRLSQPGGLGEADDGHREQHTTEVG